MSISDSNGPDVSIDGAGLAAMAEASSHLLEDHSHIANALNVFPVPDGDTGTNMSLTMRAVAAAARQNAERDTPAEDVARAMARSALMEARGNSGVILSQFFRGLSEGLAGTHSFDAAHMAGALEAASQRSYGAVGEPVEGTMLTVIAAAAKEARRCADLGQNIASTLKSVCDVSASTVEATEEMLPVLTEAEVVDSGGYGIHVILTAMAISAAGDAVEGVQVPVPGGKTPSAAISLSQDFLDKAEHVGFGFCTQLLVRVELEDETEPDLDAIRTRAGELASSVVVVGDADLVKIHVHTEQPEVVFEYAEALGEVMERSAQDMDEQRVDFAASHRLGDVDSESTSLLAVCVGNGLAAVFADLGAYDVVSGGPTMNPSVRSMAEAIERAPTDVVVVLPNDGNVVATAEQAAEMVGKRAMVVPTRTVQQGVAAALEMDPAADPEACVKTMSDAAQEIRSGSITVATRNVTLDGVRAQAGAYIAVLDDTLAAAGPSISEVVGELLLAAEVEEEDLVTLYRGDPVSPGEAGAEIKRLRQRFRGVEFDLVAGGQPHYHYLVAIE